MILLGLDVKNVQKSHFDVELGGAALFENPIILAQWQVKRVAHTEMAIHYTLKARGLWIDDAPGREWFKTTLATINGIVENICE